MTPQLIVIILIVYFSALLLISWYTAKGADTDAFFMANKQSPWYLVAFGMIGTSLSGVTFISVPGKVGVDAFSYYQIVLGNLVGYLVIVNVLMPLYYRLNLISIYTYLETRLGKNAYKTGASFFLLSRTIGSSLRLFLAAAVLQTFLFEDMGVPFWITVVITIVLIWIYTFKGGIKTIVWTDSFQTIFLVSSVVICVVLISQRLDFSFGSMLQTVYESKYSKIFVFDSFLSSKYFWKQFVGGAMLAICMTGLDQDLMQKNLSCKNIGEAQKNMYSFMGVFMVVNLLFLTLGSLLYIYIDQEGLAAAMPTRSDYIFPTLALKEFGIVAGIFFLLGITASSYASADSALTALTTSFCIDFLDFHKKEEAQKKRQKFMVHVGFSFLFFAIIVGFSYFSSKSVVDWVLKAASYTYGPLLGLFSFGLFTKWNVKDKFVPYICVVTPVLTYLLDIYSVQLLGGYAFSYEILLINGGMTMFGLWLIRDGKIVVGSKL